MHFTAIIFLVIALAAQAQERRIDVAWTQGPEALALSYVPTHTWLDDGTVLIADTATGLESPRVMRLDPKTGESRVVLDLREPPRAIWRQDPNRRPELALPEEFDRSGQRALYLIGGDLWLIELEGVAVKRITATPEPEHAAQFSPDGKRVAFVRANDLYVFDIDGAVTSRLTQDGAPTVLNGTLSWVYWEEIFGRRDIGYWWSHDSSAIAFLRTDESGVGVVPFIDHRSQYPTTTSQRYPKVGGANPVVTVGIVELAGEAPTTTWIDLDEHPHEYLARVQWHPGDEQVAVQVLNRTQDRLDLLFAERATGHVHPVLTERDPGWINLHDDLHFTGDGHFLWASERDGFYHLYRYDLTGKLVGRVTSGEFALRDPGGVFWTRQAVKAIDIENGWVYASALAKSSVESHLFRFSLDGETMTRITREDGTHKVSFSPDAHHYLDVWSRANRPPSLSLHRADGELLQVISASRTEEAAALGFCYPELFSIPAGDGFPMPAYVMKPRDFDAKKAYPLILYGYGGPSAPKVSDQWSSDLYLNQLLVDRGFVVACVDNRSATAVSKRLENTILGSMYGDGELQDLLAATRWFATQAWVDAERVGLWGWSGGGTLTLLGMTHSHAFRAGIAVAAVTRWEYYDTKWAEAVMKRPEENGAGYRDTDLVRRARDLHGRLLLVHGSGDDNVHIQNAWAFADALIDSGKVFEMMIYPMRKHGISDRAARIHLYRTMLDFWERHL